MGRNSHPMNAPPTHPQTALGSEEKQRFLAVIVYEDTITCERAERVYQHLLPELQHGADFQCAWFSFLSLNSPTLAEVSEIMAHNADVILFSTHASNDLPAHVKEWIEKWVPEKDFSNSALAALVGLPEDLQKGMTPIHTYLRDVANRGHMEFISQAICESASVERAAEHGPISFQVDE